MAKNDYFCIAYRILKYLYECFKAEERPEPELFSPDALGINNGFWVNIMESLSNEGYIVGVSVFQSMCGTQGVKLLNPKITEKGIDFLQNNSNTQKAIGVLKTVGDIIPGF